jgi:hypothetical protein
MSIQALVPSWEDPITRFVNGVGELQISPNGAAFTLWETLTRFKDSQFPIQVQDREFSKQELLARDADILNAGDPASAKTAVGPDGLAKVEDLCRQAGLLTS